MMEGRPSRISAPLIPGIEILSVLGEDYDGDNQMVEKDVVEFIDQLRSSNIISV